MKKSNLHDKCREIVARARELAPNYGYENKITISGLEKVIAELCGMDKRTIKRWREVLSDFAYTISESQHLVRLGNGWTVASQVKRLEEFEKEEEV